MKAEQIVPHLQTYNISIYLAIIALYEVRDVKNNLIDKKLSFFKEIKRE